MADPGCEEVGGARGYYPQKIMIEGEKNCLCNLVYIKKIGGGIKNTRLFPNIFPPFKISCYDLHRTGKMKHRA